MPALFLKTVLPSTAKGLVSAEQITEMMVAAQKESYADGLASYHPHFWAAKLHFFIDDVPFYNFPYTFGYLFSMGIYAYANQKGRVLKKNILLCYKTQLLCRRKNWPKTFRR